MKQLLNNWNIVRFIRFIIGTSFAIYALITTTYILLFIAGLLLMQAIFNISCCGQGNCSPTYKLTEQKEVYKQQIKKYKA